MTNLIIELSKYALIILMAIYTCLTFLSFSAKTKKGQRFMFVQMSALMLAVHFVAYIVLYLKLEQENILVLYGSQVIFFLIVLILWHMLYPGVNKTILSNVCMLLTISFIILARITYEKSVKQFKIVAVSMLISLFVPILIRKVRSLEKMTKYYGAVGIVLLAAVLLLSKTTYGANLSFTIAGITLQPSEFVKLLFVFFVAGRLQKSTEFRDVVITTVLAGIHVLILVASRDLGGALLLFVTYLVMLYIATKNPLYFFSGLLAGSAAGFAAFHLFSHVRVRVQAWSDPWSCIDTDGYQVAQSLFAIGTGGWLGMGLCQGSPSNIPFVEKDSVFSAIAEELGGIFAICLILVCMSLFLAIFMSAMNLKDSFYRYTAMGLGTMYAFQVFLTVGGVIKFIPLTGVTLPLVSYGGSSALSTLLLFAVIQGIYLLKEDEEQEIEKERERLRSDSGREVSDGKRKKKKPKKQVEKKS